MFQWNDQTMVGRYESTRPYQARFRPSQALGMKDERLLAASQKCLKSNLEIYLYIYICEHIWVGADLAWHSPMEMTHGISWCFYVVDGSFPSNLVFKGHESGVPLGKVVTGDASRAQACRCCISWVGPKVWHLWCSVCLARRELVFPQTGVPQTHRLPQHDQFLILLNRDVGWCTIPQSNLTIPQDGGKDYTGDGPKGYGCHKWMRWKRRPGAARRKIRSDRVLPSARCGLIPKRPKRDCCLVASCRGRWLPWGKCQKDPAVASVAVNWLCGSNNAINHHQNHHKWVV